MDRTGKKIQLKTFLFKFLYFGSFFRMLAVNSVSRLLFFFLMKKFFCCFCQVSNSRPSSHVSSALQPSYSNPLGLPQGEHRLTESEGSISCQGAWEQFVRDAFWDHSSFRVFGLVLLGPHFPVATSATC